MRVYKKTLILSLEDLETPVKTLTDRLEPLKPKSLSTILVPKGKPYSSRVTKIVKALRRGPLLTDSIEINEYKEY